MEHEHHGTHSEAQLLRRCYFSFFLGCAGQSEKRKRATDDGIVIRSLALPWHHSSEWKRYLLFSYCTHRHPSSKKRSRTERSQLFCQLCDSRMSCTASDAARAHGPRRCPASRSVAKLYGCEAQASQLYEYYFWQARARLM